jgi:hypothetical protein
MNKGRQEYRIESGGMCAVATPDLRLLPALAEIRATLGVGDLAPLPGGGSTARVWRAATAAGEPVVIKYLDAAAGLVDGHDLSTFSLKPRQISRVHADLAALSPCYIRVIGEWRGPGWAAYAMPYVPGRAVTEPLRRASPDGPGFLRDLGGILRVLTENGYAAQTRPAPTGHFHALNVDRVRRRLPLLRACLDPALFGGLVVNGRYRPPVTRLLDQLACRAAALPPGLLHYPVHGDLNLGNLMVGPAGPHAGFTVLDPRGTLEFWDVSYDMAKVLFSLALYEPAMDGGFRVVREAGAAGAPSYRVALRHPRPAYAAAAAQLPGLLGSLPFFTRLDQADPGWRARLAYSHAVHCLAEAACRLSDRRPRAFGPTRGWAACYELSAGLFLAGVTLLDELLTCDADPGSAAPGAAAWLPGLADIMLPPPAGDAGPPAERPHAGRA